MDDARKVAAERLRAHLDQLRADIAQIDAEQAQQRLAEGATLIDVREAGEWADGTVPGAWLISRGQLELVLAERAPDPEQELILMCAGGDRSQLAATALKALGYRRLANLSGGFRAWTEAGLPRQLPEPVATAQSRYLRHLSLPEVGADGQRRLGRATISIIGAGGLGSPAALYLAAAGVGCLRLIDADRVERSNLQRQILHADHLVGHLKTESAAQRLHALNPDIMIDTQAVRLVENNAPALLAGSDLVIDGSDNFPTRYLLNRVCRALGIPLVYGAVLRFSGQVALFDPAVADAGCYRCLYPEAPLPADAPSCAEAGVLGVMPGIVGCLQAAEALKYLLGIGGSLSRDLLLVDAIGMDFRKLRRQRDPDCADCGARSAPGPNHS